MIAVYGCLRCRPTGHLHRAHAAPPPSSSLSLPVSALDSFSQQLSQQRIKSLKFTIEFFVCWWSVFILYLLLIVQFRSWLYVYDTPSSSATISTHNIRCWPSIRNNNNKKNKRSVLRSQPQHITPKTTTENLYIRHTESHRWLFVHSSNQLPFVR